MGYIRPSYRGWFSPRMNRWGDDVVRLVGKNKDVFKAVEQSAFSTGHSTFLTASQDGAGTDRFPAVNQRKQPPKRVDKRPVSEGSLTQSKVRPPSNSEVKGIMQSIADMSEDIGAALKDDRQLASYHVVTIWLSKNYRPTHEGALPDAAEAQDEVKTELRAHVNKLIDDLVGNTSTPLRRRIAAVVASELQPTAYTVGENLIDDMKKALASASSGPDLAVRYDTTIALAKLARTFYRREGMTPTAIAVLLETVDTFIRRGDEQFVRAPMASLIRTYDRLTSHPDNSSRLAPGLEPYSQEVLKGIDMLNRLMKGGADIDVRTLAKDTRTALQERMKAYPWNGTPGACPMDGSGAPQNPPVTSPMGGAGFQSMASYMGMNAATIMPSLPRIPRVF